MRRILLVDDSPTARLMARRLLERGGASLVEAGSYREGIAALGHPTDGALLDIDLGDGSGLDLACALLAANPACQVVFVTASSDPAQLERARLLAPVFHKPAGLHPAVDALLGGGAALAPPRPVLALAARLKWRPRGAEACYLPRR